MNNEQILGLATGIIFGFLLQKGSVLRFDKQVGAMLFNDMTIFKFMLSAIIVGMTGIYAMHDFGLITLSHKTMNIGGLVAGGILFGIGWAVAGYCPGTAVGAVAEGRWHAIWVIAGMLVGAALYAELYPFYKRTILAVHDMGKVSLPELIGVNHWIVMAAFTFISLIMFIIFEKRKI